MAPMELKPFDELLDEFYGKPGTSRRDDFERAVDADVKAWEMGEAIRKARREKHLTQEELGERIGVKKAQISRIEIPLHWTWRESGKWHCGNQPPCGISFIVSLRAFTRILYPSIQGP